MMRANERQEVWRFLKRSLLFGVPILVVFEITHGNWFYTDKNFNHLVILRNVNS